MIDQANPTVGDNNSLAHKNRSILDPYRTLGCFVSGKITLTQTQPFSLAVPTRNSYKVYSDALAIKVVSPPLSGQVQSVLSHNEYSYAKVSNKVIKMKYHHIVRQWQIPEQNLTTKQTATLMKFDNIVLLGQGRRVYVIDQKQVDQQKQVTYYQVSQPFVGMVHPVTYINKLVLYGPSSISLVNPLSSKTLYEYPNLRTYLKQSSLTIVAVQASKLVNIVALSLSNGEILIFNLKKDEIVFKMKLKNPALTIAFSDQHAMMATADAIGNVVLWDLENKKILYKFEESIEGAIDSLLFIPNQPILTCGSSQQNCLKQLRINLQDNRILTLFRQRNGLTSPIHNINLLNNNQLVLSSQTQSMFTSLYSHTNNYKLSKVLDSSSPYHLISKHFSVQLFKNQTMDKSFNIHESAHVGKVSLSQKYFIVGTKSRVVKLGVTGVQLKVTGVKEIVLFQEHFVFVVTDIDVIVLDFVTFQVVKKMGIGKCSKAVTNQFGNLLALYNQTNNTIQVYDMQKLQLARQFTLPTQQKVNCLTFTSDNKYLLSSHSNSQLKIWSIVHNNLFKEFVLSNPIVDMSFTEDNQFFLSVFENEREINIWNNYLGKISSSREKEALKFDVVINRCEEDFRKVLARKLNLVKKEEQGNREEQSKVGDQVLASIPDSEDAIPEYHFVTTQKWLPLIYFDQIKERNTMQNAKQFSLPFFLDFKNLEEEKKKMHDELKQDIINKKNQKQSQIDKHLKNETHEITLTEDSTSEQYEKCLIMLEKLSLAEIDYQLRTFLLNPANKRSLLKMFEYLIRRQVRTGVSQQFLNILFHRALYLIGNQIFDSQLKEVLGSILGTYTDDLTVQKNKIDKCIAITQKIM